MKRRFLVATQGFTVAQEAEFTNYARDLGMGWWHWIEGFWLLTTKREDITVITLRDKLGTIVGKSRALVMEIPDDITWAGREGFESKVEIFDWLRSTWKEP